MPQESAGSLPGEYEVIGFHIYRSVINITNRGLKRGKYFRRCSWSSVNGNTRERRVVCRQYDSIERLKMLRPCQSTTLQYHFSRLN